MVQARKKAESTELKVVDGTMPYWTTKTGRGRVYHGKCEEVAKSLPVRNYQLIFADPPFNIDRDYDEYRDSLLPEHYISWTDKWIQACLPLLSIDGSFCVAIGDDHVADVKLALDRAGLKMRNWIIWHYTFGTHCQTKFGRDHTHILYYVRDQRRLIFNADAIRIQSERQRMGDKRSDPRGRVPGDVWHTHFDDDANFKEQVWTHPRLVGNAKERTEHTCQMPESVLTRLILALTNDNDSVLDPFGGSGTTLSAALKANRRCDTIELSKNYINSIIIPRIQSGV